MPADGPEIADPYTLVYDWLYDKVLVASQGLRIAMKKENIVSLNTKEGLAARRDVVRPSHLPEIVLTSANVDANLNLTSDTAQIFRDYRLLITSNKGGLGSTIYPVEWALTCALLDANYDAELRQLKWHGQAFVKATSLMGVESGESDPEINRGIASAWAAVWILRVHMILARASMQNFNRGLPIPELSV